LTAPASRRRATFAPERFEIDGTVDWIASTAREMGATERQSFAAKLCAEELLSNMRRHGTGSPAVSLTLERDGDGRLLLAIEDDGAPFDPTQGPEREALGALDDARPGGWGLPLIRRFADDFTYRRSETGNLVLLAFLA
jgi:sigma-B regulation protein RsbU (phosphoserine phosphatase)